MQRLTHDELRESLSLFDGKPGMDNQAALRLKKQLAEQFRQQLTLGVPDLPPIVVPLVRSLPESK
jgi:bacterioferritin (cytochrome b1)